MILHGMPVNEAIIKAINDKLLLSFEYRNRQRIVEPHVYGIIKPDYRLHCWQLKTDVSESSQNDLPNWRTMDVKSIHRLRVLDDTFAGPRLVSGDHLDWDDIFAKVEP